MVRSMEAEGMRRAVSMYVPFANDPQILCLCPSPGFTGIRPTRLPAQAPVQTLGARHAYFARDTLRQIWMRTRRAEGLDARDFPRFDRRLAALEERHLP